jgi:hypothetical protein
MLELGKRLWLRDNNSGGGGCTREEEEERASFEYGASVFLFCLRRERYEF